MHDHEANHMQARDSVEQSACSGTRHGSDWIAHMLELLAGTAKLACHSIRGCMEP